MLDVVFGSLRRLSPGHLFLFARHGETVDNARRVFQGQAGSGLNRLGRVQAARLGERLRPSPPALIVASDLERAVETAQIVAAATGAPVELERGLREVDVGSWTGLGYDEVKERYPEEWAAWDRGLDVRRGGGETYRELADRVVAAVAAIAERHPPESVAGKSILLVSHGGSIRSFVARILESAPLDVLGGVANTSLTSVERLAGRTPLHRLHSWNDIAHLEGLVAEEHAD